MNDEREQEPRRKPEGGRDCEERPARLRLRTSPPSIVNFRPGHGSMRRFAALGCLILSCDALRTSTSHLGRRAAVGAAVGCSVLPCAATAREQQYRSEQEATFRSVATQVGGDDFIALPSGVQFKEVRVGTGDKVAMGDTVSIQFSGRCLNLNGKKFISTQDKSMLSSGLDISEPFVFTLGSGNVIPGLEQAVVGMSKGGYRRVVIPQALGYDKEMTLQPTPASFEESRSLQSIVKNPNRDASLLYDVSLDRIKSKR